MTKKKGRRAYLDDYEAKEDGSYAYTGLLWRWAEPEQRAGFLREARTLLGVAIACSLGAGFVPAPGVGNAFFVLVPYVISIVGLSLSCVCVWRVMREGECLRNHVYVSAGQRLRAWLIVGALAAGLSAIGELICVLAGGGGVEAPLLGAAFALCECAAAACFACLARRAHALAFEPVD